MLAILLLIRVNKEDVYLSRKTDHFLINDIIFFSMKLQSVCQHVSPIQVTGVSGRGQYGSGNVDILNLYNV